MSSDFADVHIRNMPIRLLEQKARWLMKYLYYVAYCYSAHPKVGVGIRACYLTVTGGIDSEVSMNEAFNSILSGSGHKNVVILNFTLLRSIPTSKFDWFLKAARMIFGRWMKGGAS